MRKKTRTRSCLLLFAVAAVRTVMCGPDVFVERERVADGGGDERFCRRNGVFHRPAFRQFGGDGRRERAACSVRIRRVNPLRFEEFKRFAVVKDVNRIVMRNFPPAFDDDILGPEFMKCARPLPSCPRSFQCAASRKAALLRTSLASRPSLLARAFPGSTPYFPGGAAHPSLCTP